MIQEQERRSLAMELVWAALGAVNPTRAVAAQLQLMPDHSALHVGGREYNLETVERVLVVGAGKAGAGMATAVEAFLGGRIAAGWVNVRYGYEPAHPLETIHIHSAGHPIPDAAGQEGTRRMLDILESAGKEDLVLVLISGGASSLLVSPVDGVSLQDAQLLTDALLRCGASIGEINTVRKHISQVKGGQLARLVAQRGAQAAVLVISDVVGNPLDAIGSGPCTPDPTTFGDAWQVLDRHRLLDTIPSSILSHLESGLQGKVPETPKPGEEMFECIHHTLVADNRVAALAAAQRANALDLDSVVLTTYLEGEAREVGRVLAGLAKGQARGETHLPRPACLILGGETTVTIRGDGKGGRNQEVALGAALGLDGWGPDLMVVAVGTDGSDGPTDAAGAVATGDTAPRARELGLDPIEHLARNDSYNLFSALGDLIITGPTGTNVNDLAFVLVF